jgi:hypothetical protein
MVENQVQIPMNLVREYKETPKILRGFFTNLLDLIQYLRNERYIRESTMMKWEEGIKRAYQYLDNFDVLNALKEIHKSLRGLQLILDKISSEAFWKNQPIPEALKNRYENIAESIWDFRTFLFHIINYYTNTYNSPPAIWAYWYERANNTYWWIRDGDIIGSIGTIISIMNDLESLINEIRNQVFKVN